jgi:hypothetical protein
LSNSIVEKTMASDYGLDKPESFTARVRRMGGGEFDFSKHDNAADVNRVLKTFKDCADRIFVAEGANEIKLEPGVTGTMLEVMGLLLMRAAHTPPENGREAMLRIWADRGPQMIDELIETVKTRPGTMMVRDDFAMFMGCPDGYEI